MTNRGGGRSRERGVAWGLATAKIHAKIGEQARAKVKKRNETWEKTQHQPQTSGQMGKWAKEGRGLPGMAPAHATRCGSSAASIEIPNNRVECTCKACAASRHKKKQEVNERKAPKPKYYGKKCKNAQRSAVKYVARGWRGRMAALVGGAIKKRVSSSPKAGAAKCSNSSSRDTSTRCNE